MKVVLLFPYDYIYLERKIKPILTLQCYDADQFTADDLLGRIDLDLGRVLRCLYVFFMLFSEVSLYFLYVIFRGASSSDKCTPKMVTNRNWPTVDLFKARQIRGWWPFMSSEHSDLAELTVLK